MYYLGIDLGSSSLKVALVEQKTGVAIAQLKEPEEEMDILSLQEHWAEQDPEYWWELCCRGIQRILAETEIDATDIKGIGIAYQMHGLVTIDQGGSTVRNAIIWCDSRAVEIGEEAYQKIGTAFCDRNFLNSPGNFTAAKLAWVKQNEPERYAKIHKIMLPGDFLAYRFSGECTTTVTALSEGVFWNFPAHTLANEVNDQLGIDVDLFPTVVDNFTQQVHVNNVAAKATGLIQGTPILYRAGDQPNNALSLNVFNPGEVAATAGTSGVVYAVTDQLEVNEAKRLNHFAHVNHQKGENRIGKLLCINGAGRQYNWMRENLSMNSYEEMNILASSVAVGAEGLCVLPFGNGAERMFGNRNLGSSILHLDLNRHNKAHLCRASLEGTAFAFTYGFSIMQKDKVQPKVIRTGNDNMFQSEIFSTTIATLLGIDIEIYETTGAIGAARAAIHAQDKALDFSSLIEKDYLKTISPDSNLAPYSLAFNNWKKELETTLKTSQ